MRKIVASLPAWLNQFFAEDIGGSTRRRHLVGIEQNEIRATVWSLWKNKLIHLQKDLKQLDKRSFYDFSMI